MKYILPLFAVLIVGCGDNRSVTRVQFKTLSDTTTVYTIVSGKSENLMYTNSDIYICKNDKGVEVCGDPINLSDVK